MTDKSCHQLLLIVILSRGPNCTYLEPLSKQGGNHAVAVKHYSKGRRNLTLILIDSLAKSGETVLKEGFQKPPDLELKLCANKNLEVC